MSFSRLKKDELLKVAESFGVDVDPSVNKDIIIAELTEMGVTFEDATRHNAVEPEVALEIQAEVAVEHAQAKAAERQELIKMERENKTYEVRGYKFTSSAPFALVSELDAEWITDNVEGFRYAKPREAAEFYS